MKKSFKTIVLIASLTTPVFHQTGLEYMTVEASSSTANQEDESDAIVEIDENQKFKEMDQKEKDKIYKEFDKISSSSKDERIANDFASVKEVKSEKAYKDLIEKSKEEPVIIYLGFNECPYCKSFIPKLSHLANEYKAEINYYNTNHREDDQNFEDVIYFFDIETVPHAFIVKDGKIQDKLNEKSKMKDMENFLIHFNKLQNK